MPKENMNIYGIAKEAGVSPATVSRVLTNNAKVSEDKKSKILAVIEKYDYKPNALARGLSATESKTIGILTSDIRNPFYAALFVECEKAANERGYTVILCNSLGDNALEESHLEQLAERRVDAIIQMGGRVDELITDVSYVEHINKIANWIPIVVNGKLDGADCCQVSIDEGQALELAMEYLIHLGHKDIALVGGRRDVKSTYDKQLRYRKLLSKYGIAGKENLLVESGDYDIESGFASMKQLFMQKELPTAVIAINDFTAIGIIKAIKEKGLSIPEDISVVSFDNTYLSEVSTPNLTTVDYNFTKYGEMLVEVALKAIRNENPPKVQFVSAELIIRNSCKRI